MESDGWGATSQSSGMASTRKPQLDNQWWWSTNSYLRFYGMVFLIGTKTTDAITTAVGLQYVPGIVEMNPVADAVFADSGTVAGLVFLSFITVIVTVLLTEWLAVNVHRRLGMSHLALASKVVIYGGLSLLFGLIALQNSLLISQQVQAYLVDLFTLSV